MNLFFRQAIFFICFALAPVTFFSQDVLTGVVYSKADSTALPGASVYFDGTSIGVATNMEGKFRITGEGTTSPLIISMLGHKTFIVADHSKFEGKLPPIYLEESQERLGEVHLETDPWTQKKKLGIFRREFLGHTPAASKCKIVNEDALELRYIPSRETMVAYANEPLTIINRHLGYEITYNLTDFKVEFSTGTVGLQLVHLVYFEGTSFFKELRKSPPGRFLKNRKKAYTGSTLHFMRSLASRKLHENHFRIFDKSYEVPPYKPFSINNRDNLVLVELLTPQVTILHDELDQSAMEVSGPFFIDQLGNHTPPQAVIFSGEMGAGRAAQILPLDYQPGKGKNN